MRSPSRSKIALLTSALSVAGLLVVVALRRDLPVGGGRVKAPTDPGSYIELPTDPRPLPPGAVARLGFQRGNDLPGRREVVTAGYSGDGKFLITEDWHGGANRKGHRLWNGETGAPLGEVRLPHSSYYGGSLSPDGSRVAWGSNDGNGVSTAVSDVATGRILWRTKGGGRSVFTPDGRHVIGGSHVGTTMVFDAATGEVLHTLSEKGRFANGYVVSRDGATVAVSSERIRDLGKYEQNEARLEVWDVATGRLSKVVASRPYHFGSSHLFALSPNGKKIAYTDSYGLKRIALTFADSETGLEIWRLENAVSERVWHMIGFAPDDASLLVKSSNDGGIDLGTMELLDASDGRTLRRFDEESASPHSRAAYSPDGRRVVTYGEGVPFRIWDTATGHLLPVYDGHRRGVYSMAMNRDGSTVASTDGYSICVWDGPAGKLRRRFDAKGVAGLGLDAGGRSMIATGASETATQLFDLSANTRRVLARHQTTLSAISPDGKRAAIWRFDNSIAVIDTDTGKVVHALAGHRGERYALAFSGDGHRLLTAATTRPPNNFLEEWDKPAPPIPDDTLRAWDLDTGKEVRKWERIAGCAALSSDGRTMIAGCADGRVRRMDVVTGKELEPLAFHRGPVQALAVGGGRAASADAGGIVVWDQATGAELRRFAPDHGTTDALAFSGDGRWLSSAGADGTILVWFATGSK